MRAIVFILRTIIGILHNCVFYTLLLCKVHIVTAYGALQGALRSCMFFFRLPYVVVSFKLSAFFAEGGFMINASDDRSG